MKHFLTYVKHSYEVILETESRTKINLDQENKRIYGDKHHFFIGTLLNHRDDIASLNKLRNYLKKNPNFNQLKWPRFYTSYIYLGYIDSDVAKEMMTKIFHPLCLAVTEKYNKLNCNYKELKYRSKPPRDRGQKIISIEYEDKGDILNKKIIPYLHNEGLKKIYDVERKVKEKPHIDLLYLKCNDDVYRQSSSMVSSVKLPKDFDIDHLCLIKGTPIEKRFGTQSKYDRLNIECMNEYYYPFRGTS